MEIQIRQKLNFNVHQDVARVQRILRVQDRLYLQVEITEHTTSWTLMTAVNAALDRYLGRPHG